MTALGRGSVVVAIALATLCASAGAEPPVVPASQVVVATTTGDALIIWDATVAINDLATHHVADADALRRIEATAGALLVQKAKKLGPAAKTVTVRIMYASSPLVEVYRTATFEGFDELAHVSAARDESIAKAAVWTAVLMKNTIPAGMTVTVVGHLPKP